MAESNYEAGFPTEIVEEGQGKFLVPKLKAFVKSPSDYAPSKAPVFYNPIMELNRDITVLALQAYQRTVNHDISVCEPLTGCGIRGVRFAVEVDGVKKVVVNDISERSCQIAKQNVCMNGVEKKVVVKHEDANLLLSKHSAPHKRFDAVDVDPFGSPVRYVDSAVRALRNRGLLALTATDMAPLCGVHPKACVRKYGGKPLRTEYCHELAVRLLAGCLATMAAKHEVGINVVFSHNADHYVRVYATVEYGAKKADESLKNMGYVLHCFKCFHRESLAGLSAIGHSGKCSECGSKLSAGGPMWLGKLFDKNFCELMETEAEQGEFRHRNKIEKTVALAKNEIDMPVGYFVIDKLCDALNLPVPSVKRVIEALRKEGFQTSPTCFNPKGVKTDASAAKMRELLQQMMNAESKNLI
jgi:tRNA (guanine26-N2/guanine27-N2)-dimethyltransferase